jgi:hypothetical protein
MCGKAAGAHDSPWPKIGLSVEEPKGDFPFTDIALLGGEDPFHDLLLSIL